MSEVKWIKIYLDLFDDEKIKLIDAMPEKDTVFVIWIRLLLLAGKINDGGLIYLADAIPYTDEMLSTIFNRPLNVVRLALKVLQDFKMIEIDQDMKIKIVNWDKRQNVDGLQKIRDDNKRRVAAYRDRKRLAQLADQPPDGCNVTVTLRHAVEEKKNKKKKKNISKSAASNVTDVVVVDEKTERINKLFGAMKASFEAMDPDGVKAWNWNIQGPSLKRLAERFLTQPEPDVAAHGILKTYYRAIKVGRDAFWKNRPFTPADLNTESIFTQVWAMARKAAESRAVNEEVDLWQDRQPKV